MKSKKYFLYFFFWIESDVEYRFEIIIKSIRNKYLSKGVKISKNLSYLHLFCKNYLNNTKTNKLKLEII